MKNTKLYVSRKQKDLLKRRGYEVNVLDFIIKPNYITKTQRFLIFLLVFGLSINGSFALMANYQHVPTGAEVLR